MVRVTLAGDDLADFASDGPADHVKLFLPDPATGILTTPVMTPEGPRRPTEGTVISRDYTPRLFHDGLLDIDFVVHGDEGPASAWAAQAAVGQSLAVAGPRGSRLAPSVSKLFLVVDETALPSASRWLALEGVTTTAIFDVADESVEAYFDESTLAGVDATWVHRTGEPGLLESTLRELGPIDDETFVFLAGEASALVPLRRYLRRELGLPAEQVSASGYWKRGVTNLDHHAPLDETDPD